MAGNSFKVVLSPSSQLELGQSVQAPGFEQPWDKELTHPTSTTTKGTVSNPYLAREPPLSAGCWIQEITGREVFTRPPITFSSTELRELTLQDAEPWIGKGRLPEGQLCKRGKTTAWLDVHYLEKHSWLCSLKLSCFPKFYTWNKILLPWKNREEDLRTTHVYLQLMMWFGRFLAWGSFVGICWVLGWFCCRFCGGFKHTLIPNVSLFSSSC